jgi:hypothetical protein
MLNTDFQHWQSEHRNVVNSIGPSKKSVVQILVFPTAVFYIFDVPKSYSHLIKNKALGKDFFYHCINEVKMSRPAQ